MLKSWQMTNFKSYNGKQDIPLSWINVVAGANSSGKSTLIQSILLLKQTVQYAGRDKSLLLNGPILRLGEFSDIVNTDAVAQEISLAFTCEYSQQEMNDIRRTWSRRNIMFLHSLGTEYISCINLNCGWNNEGGLAGDGPSPRKFNPTLVFSTVSVSKDIKGELSRQHITLTKENTQVINLEYRADLDDVGRRELYQDRPSAEVRGGYVEKFLPQFVAIEYDRRAKRSAEIVTYLFDDSWTLLGRSTQYNTAIAPEPVVDLILSWVNERGAEHEIARPANFKDLRELVEKALPARNMFQLGRATSVSESDTGLIRGMVTSALVNNLPPERDFDLVLPSSMREAISLISDYFLTAVLYLGPLRDAPKPVYQVEALPSATDVGYRGEHTAAVLDLNKDEPIRFVGPPSEDLADDYISSAHLKTALFHDAVVEWLSYLGVAEEVQTSDNGVFGNRLQVKTSGNSGLHDLTNVGVGVSQILPIVVMALLAPAGSLLIFEQPELHLHPKVQARLADFFLSLSVQRKQVLAETHSEYIVDRLRLRVALSEKSDLAEKINILFSDRSEGSTRLVPVELTEFGSVVSWPRDFFDQSQGDVARILSAAAQKRRAKRTK
jgi:predicted ATPase